MPISELALSILMMLFSLFVSSIFHNNPVLVRSLEDPSEKCVSSRLRRKLKLHLEPRERQGLCASFLAGLIAGLDYVGFKSPPPPFEY